MLQEHSCYLKIRFIFVFKFTSSKLHIRSLDFIIYARSATTSRFFSFSASADPTDTLVYHALAFNIFLSPTVLAKVTDTLI